MCMRWGGWWGQGPNSPISGAGRVRAMHCARGSAAPLCVLNMGAAKWGSPAPGPIAARVDVWGWVRRLIMKSRTTAGILVWGWTGQGLRRRGYALGVGVRLLEYGGVGDTLAP